jgi:hypothetical protein
MLRSSLVAVASLVSLSSIGCVSLIVDAAKKHTINMEHWELQTLEVGLRGDSAGICPGTSVQLAVVGNAKHRKNDKVKRLETWSGDPGSANRNGKMSFAEFDIGGAGGTLDENGFFVASPDMIATAISGFDLRATYKRDTKLTETKHYPPSYDCISTAGLFGAGGAGGYQGEPGNPGNNGEPGTGGSGGSGAGPGSDGGPGGPGGQIVAYATIVRTPHHPHVGILHVTGDIEQLLLFDPKRKIAVYATGGGGGAGGQGGAGGNGGNGGAGNPGGPGGTGGPGGNGANGGQGGPGGSVVLIYDAKFPELAELIALDASGGAGGDAGWAGPGGGGGAGGSAEGEGAEAGPDGAVGSEGIAGQPGQGGANGVVRAQPGDVASAFADLPAEIVRL